MRTANWAEAADYINQMYGLDSQTPIASLATLAVNQPGVIEFKISPKAFGANSFGTLLKLLTNMKAVHGSDYLLITTPNSETYTWELSSTRSVVCVRRSGKGPASGIYIQLKDTGN